MERPGFLEFVVYALVLVVAAGWVYALPPFDYERGRSVQLAQSEAPSATPAATSSGESESGSAETVSDNESQDAAAGGDAPATPEPVTPDSTSEPGEQPAADARPDLMVVTARSLNMRAQPNSRSALVGSYPRGSLVEKVETSGNWVLVRTEDESTGWMYAGYLDALEAN